MLHKQDNFFVWHHGDSKLACCLGGPFTADILLLLHTGFFITCSLRKRLIMDGRFVARYYVLHATCFTDVLATIPAWIEVRIPADYQPAS